jgi:hypothetical protein
MIIALLGLTGCDLLSKTDAEVLAKVYQEKLTLDELALPGANLDSLQHLEQQVNDWATRQLWANAAKDVPYTPRMARLVADYKNSLLIAEYQQDLIAQSNVQVDEQMVLDYYKANQANFLMDKDMYKFQYFQLTTELDPNNIMARLDEGVLVDELSAYCEENPAECMLSATWVEPGTLEAIELPAYLWKTSGKFAQYYKADGQTILYRIEAKITAGESKPLDIVRENIVSMLTFHLEQEIIEKHEAALLLNAQNEEHFEIY